MARRWAHPVRSTRHGWRVVKGSLAWHYLKRQKRFLLLLLVVLPVGGIAYIPVIGLTRAMVDQGIVDQTVPLSYYLWRIIGLAVLAGFFVFALTRRSPASRTNSSTTCAPTSTTRSRPPRSVTSTRSPAAS